MKNRLKECVVAVALTLGAVQVASADTLQFMGPSLGSWDGTFAIATPPESVLAGLFRMKDTSGATYPVGTSFDALCLTPFVWLTSPASYTLTTGASYFTGFNAGKTTDLERLASYVYDNSLAGNPIGSAAFQLAAWEVANETTDGFYTLTSGNFTVTGGEAVAIASAESWLNVVNAGVDPINQTLGVWVGAVGQEGSSITQDLAVFTPAIPEPGTYAMMLAGLGLMGFIARRRQRNIATA